MDNSTAPALEQKTSLLSVQGKEAKPLFPGSGGAGWRFIIDPPGDPVHNMQRDEAIAQEVGRGMAPPTVRIYRWERPAITIGRRQNLDDLPSDLLKKELPILRRPTGGGAVVHRLDELTYSLAVPRRWITGTILRGLPAALHESMRYLLVQRAEIPPRDLEIFYCDSDRPPILCFSSPVCGDILYCGQKVAGMALRVWREAILVQGVIQGLLVAVPFLQEILLEWVRCHQDSFRFLPWRGKAGGQRKLNMMRKRS